MTWRLLLTVALAVLARPVAAEAPTREEQARAHFSQGQIEYRAGRYGGALEQFKVGYALSPRPEFLINFAQTYRKLGEYDRAIVECDRYLATAPPPELAEEARRLEANIREEQAARAAHAPATTAGTPAETEAAKPAAPAEPRPTSRPSVIAVDPGPIATPAPAPRRGRAWVWGVVAGAAVVVIGVSVALAVTLAPQPETYPTEPLGRVSFR